MRLKKKWGASVAPRKIHRPKLEGISTGEKKERTKGAKSKKSSSRGAIGGSEKDGKTQSLFKNAREDH